MRHVRIMGLCLIAAFAVAALSVSSASALEWGKCEKVGSGGNFTGPNCGESEKAATKGTGEFEFINAKKLAAKRVSEGKSANIPFSGENVAGTLATLTTGLRECEIPAGSSIFERVTRKACAAGEGRENANEGAKLFVECQAEHDTGEAEAVRNVANVHVLFTGCAALGQLPCKSEGKAEGEVETKPLKGELGFTNKGRKEVGVLLEPAEKHGLFASLVCSNAGMPFLGTNVGGGDKVNGAEYTKSGCFGLCPGTKPAEETGGGDGIISPIKPVNTSTTKFFQNYTEEAEYPFKNIPNHFAGGPLRVLEDYLIIEENGNESEWSGAGQVVSVENTPEEEGEIKA